jgi:hypothetical protein
MWSLNHIDSISEVGIRSFSPLLQLVFWTYKPIAEVWTKKSFEYAVADFQNTDFRASATQLDHDWDQDRGLLGSKIIYLFAGSDLNGSESGSR